MKTTTKKNPTMKTPNFPFEILVENQTKLVDTITNNTQKVMEIFKMEDTWTKKGKELFEAFMKEQKQLLEAATKPEVMDKGFEGVADQWTKAMEMQMNYANKTMEFYREAITAANTPKADNPFAKMFDIYSENMNAMVETTRKNMDAFRSMWN
jgi:uncharacterized protein YukE